MDLSVIIVNYNVRPFLENALAAFRRALEGIDGEIIVVDNASDDGSAEMVARFPDVQLIQNSENLGFSRANNIAIRRSRGRLLLLINPDTVVQEDTLRVMMRFFDTHPDAGLAGCKILNPDGTFQLPCRRSFPTPWVAFTKVFGLSALFPRTRLFGRYNLTYLSPEETYPVDAVSGSFMMIRRDVVEKIGGLDESFFMYGEDLDWCFRVAQGGYKVYYVHETSIVHFKGESTRRSNIDELKHFYGAMELFVEKHYTRSAVVRFFLKAGIALRGMAASTARVVRPGASALLDGLLLDLALFLSAYWYFGNATHFTFNAHPVVWVVPAGILIAVASALGLYGAYRHSIARAGLAVVVSYLVISALVFFAKDFAYSRIVVILSGLLTFVFVPLWRLLHLVLTGHGTGRAGLFGSRTLVVGTGAVVEEVLRKLRARMGNGYEVVGLIDVNRKRLGERLAGVEIVGSTENIRKVIDELRVSEVIFAVDESLPYSAILEVIARSSTPGVNFRLVPNSQEAVLGKTRIDDLETLPLVDIEYNLSRSWNRAAKRAFDLVFSLLLLPLAYFPLRLAMVFGFRPRPGGVSGAILQVPRICMGAMSFVGLPVGDPHFAPAHETQSHLGKPGLTGIIQINEHADLRPEERERFALYYAKNQSLGLDLEILVKAMLLRRRTD
jgi:GT2 family glycosyltransferase/lipopolysaccharide/colanic/teichoic acid biosynthesis glycosyltransferase